MRRTIANARARSFNDRGIFRPSKGEPMKRILWQMLVPALLVGALLAPVSAQTNQPGTIDQRERRQQRRIRQGVRSGQLTRHEARRLERRERRIRRTTARERRANGGQLTWRERRRLNRRLNRTSRGIYRQRHDRQYRR